MTGQKINGMEYITLKLSVQEVNTMIKSLSNLPYNQVFELIENIHRQANSQVKDTSVKEKKTENN